MKNKQFLLLSMLLPCFAHAASVEFLLNTEQNLVLPVGETMAIAYSTDWEVPTSASVTVTATNGTAGATLAATSVPTSFATVSWKPANPGTYVLYHSTDDGTLQRTVTVTAPAYPDALGMTNAVWATSVETPWEVESPNGNWTLGQCILRTGAIGDDTNTWVEATVRGAGTLTFDWKVSCENRFDMLAFYVDGTRKSYITGEKDWASVSNTQDNPAEHTFRWVYSKNNSGSAGEDSGWLRNVVWTPDVSANARTVVVASAHGTATPAPGTQSYAWGDVVSFSVTSDAVVEGDSRYVFAGWTGTGSVPAAGTTNAVSFTLKENSTLTWNWNTEYRLAARSSGDGSVRISQPANAETPTNAWVGAGMSAVAVATPDTYRHFAGWSGDTNGCTMSGTTLTLPMDGPRSVVALFEPDMVTLAIRSEQGEAMPTNGVYSIVRGTQMTLAVTNDTVLSGWTQYVCTGWKGAGSIPATGTATHVTATLVADSELAWTWRTNHYISVSADGPGTVDFTEGWIAEGTRRVLTATPTATLAGFKWRGDIDGCVQNGLQLTVPVDRPRAITAVFTALTYAAALEVEGAECASDGDALWTAETTGSHDGVDACRSGAITSGSGISALEVTLPQGGDLVWWWKLDVADDMAGVDVFIDGEFADGIIDSTDGWVQWGCEVPEGTHTVRWEFWSDGPDAVLWLDQVSLIGWTPPGAETSGTPVPVPYTWLEEYSLAGGGDYEAAAQAAAANGVNTVWECYVAGLDPTNALDAFWADIQMEDDAPVVSWHPDLGSERVYTVYGKTNLTDSAWMAPPNAGHRFFRVTVALPEDEEGGGESPDQPLRKIDVALNACGGTVTPHTLTYYTVSETRFGTLPIPIRDGYVFLGWYTAAEDGTLCSASTPVPSTGTTLYAHWEKITVDGRLNMAYYDNITSSPYSTWGSSYASLKSYFAGRTPSLVTNTLAAGSTLDFGNTVNGNCKFHGKYASASTENFVILMTGYIQIAESGTYTFAKLSDDGIALYIDQTKVYCSPRDENFEDDGQKSGTIQLTEGFHEITIAFREALQKQGLKLFMKGPKDSAQVLIPQSILSSCDPTEGMPTPQEPEPEGGDPEVTNVPTSGLVAYYPFSGNARDSSGNGNHGTVNGATLTADRHGVASSAYSFDGVNDTISVPDSQSLQGISSTVTIAAWAKMSSSSGVLALVDRGGVCRLEIYPSSMRFELGRPNTILSMNTNPFSVGTWVHVAMTYDGAVVKCYINGALSQQWTTNESYSSVQGATMSIGADPFALTEYMTGSLDEIYIYNRALNAAEIQQLYQKY